MARSASRNSFAACLCWSVSSSIDWPIGLRDLDAVARLAALFFAAGCRRAPRPLLAAPPLRLLLVAVLALPRPFAADVRLVAAPLRELVVAISAERAGSHR